MNHTQKLAYLAGYFDGEGTVFVGLCSSSGKNIHLRIAIVSSDSLVIQMFADVFGGECRQVQHGTVRRKRILFRWSLTNRRAVDVLQQMMPYVVGKKEQFISACEADWNSYGNQPGPEILSRRWQARETISKLNRREIR